MYVDATRVIFRLPEILFLIDMYVLRADSRDERTLETIAERARHCRGGKGGHCILGGTFDGDPDTSKVPCLSAQS